MNTNRTTAPRDLIAAAKDRAEGRQAPAEWGYRVALEVGESFVGRWRGETTDEDNEGKRVFLLVDEDEELCYSRTYAALAREIDQAAPRVGWTIVIYRGDDYTGQQGTGYSFGVVAEPNAAPLPVGVADDGIPF